MIQYAERAVYAPYSGEKSSQVARVIFIRDGSDGKPQLVQDFNPRNYGPAPASHSGWMSGGYAI